MYHIASTMKTPPKSIHPEFDVVLAELAISDPPPFDVYILK
jgi:hypothetical protein